MKEAIKTHLSVSEIYYAARILENKTKISSQLNFRPYLKVLGFNIIESLNFASNLESSKFDEYPFMVIEEKGKFVITIPKACSADFERMILAQSLGHFILHSQSGRIPCTIPSINSSEVSVEGFWFALSLLIEKNSFIKAIQANLSTFELSNLFRVPEVAINSNLVIVKHLKDIQYD